ncbi:MAG TPA: flavodoxin family protein [Clostridia bacterium]|nr:flavodoxin family protein [Clostridia bacterium]
MKVLIISGTPKKEGLAFSCAEAAKKGVESAGGVCEIIRLCDQKLIRCAMCGDGWGECLEHYTCKYGDDGFSGIQQKIADSDAVVLTSPVYWGDMSEVTKAFFDRFRRCEARKGDDGAMAGKPVLLIASPGGSGAGAISCLEQMERLCHHLRAKVFDYVSVNRWNKDYKLETITRAAEAMASI